VNVKTIGLVLSAWLLAAGWGSAQTARNDDKEPAERRTVTSRHYEDIEVLRRILLGRLQKMYGPSYRTGLTGKSVYTLSGTDGNRQWVRSATGYGNATNNPYNPNTTVSGGGYRATGKDSSVLSPAFNLEGVYLKGQGVVYTVTLPPPEGDPRALSSSRTGKPLSEWDRMRSLVRHEKGADGDKADGVKKPSLTETFLKVLAENGHHFTRLDDKETLTLVVTFRRPSFLERLSGAEVLFRGQYDSTTATGQHVRALGEKMKANKAIEVKDVALAVRDYELLGDLHLRQGKSQDALGSYARAMELLKRYPDKGSDAKQLAGIYGKVAQAYLALQQTQAAHKAIEISLSYMKNIDEASSTAKGAKGTRASNLPAKLIISASKKLLDQAGTGKVPFAEFVKEAKVEYLPFAAKTKEGGKEK
jgi:hypothetical protein